MNNFQIKLGCSQNKSYNISDWDWFRLQSHILKHMICKRSLEKWEDIFSSQDLKKIRKDLEDKKCEGFKCSNNKRNIELCQACNSCKESPLHIEFRQKVFQYIQSALKKEHENDNGRHSHTKAGILSVISDEGVTIVLKRKYNPDEYCFRSTFIGSDEESFKDLYLSAAPENRHFILKDIALNTFRSQNQCIHYQDNFRK